MNLFPYILGPVWVLDVTLTSDGHTIAAWRCKMGGEPQQTVYDAAAVDGANGWQRLTNVTLPMCMSFLLRTLAWVALLRDTGIINTFLGSFGIGPLPLIRNAGSVILGMVYNYLPYMIMPLYTVIVKLDPRLIEAAQDLGCDSFQVFRRVILPLSVPGIVSGITMVFVPAVSTFYISQKLGGTNNTMIGDVIELQFKGSLNRNFGAAMSLVLMLLVFVSIWLMNRFTDDEEGVATI